jgi:hypothetical protein
VLEIGKNNFKNREFVILLPSLLVSYVLNEMRPSRSGKASRDRSIVEENEEKKRKTMITSQNLTLSKSNKKQRKP